MSEKSEKKISYIIPVYNEEGNINTCCQEILKYILPLTYEYEIIFIDDGSLDNSWAEIVEANKKNKRVKGISFSRNFGKESAIIAGLASSSGDAVITMDADLQHPPEKIPDFIEKWEKGALIVEGIKKNRDDENHIHGWMAHLFYRLMSYSLGANFRDTSDYKLIDRKALNSILQMPEKQLFYRAITTWVGFRSDYVEYSIQKRTAGKSKWTSKKLIKYALQNVTSFTSTPLQIITIFSVIFFTLALIIGIITIIKYLSGNALGGFTTVIFLQLITGSIIMFALGLIGYYISKLYEEIKNRPRYFVAEETGFEGNVILGRNKQDEKK